VLNCMFKEPSPFSEQQTGQPDQEYVEQVAYPLAITPDIAEHFDTESTDALLNLGYKYLRAVQFDGGTEASLARQAMGEAAGLLVQRPQRAEFLIKKGIEHALNALNRKEAQQSREFVVGVYEKVKLQLDGPEVTIGMWGEEGHSTCREMPEWLGEELRGADLLSSRVVHEDHTAAAPSLYYQILTETTYRAGNKLYVFEERQHGHGREEQVKVVLPDNEQARAYFEEVQKHYATPESKAEQEEHTKAEQEATERHLEEIRDMLN
jgi:hypothetical protein